MGNSFNRIIWLPETEMKKMHTIWQHTHTHAHVGRSYFANPPNANALNEACPLTPQTPLVQYLGLLDWAGPKTKPTRHDFELVRQTGWRRASGIWS